METYVVSESTMQGARHWWENDKLRPVKVVVCTPDSTAIGYTYRLQHQRLLDALNKGFGNGLVLYKSSPTGKAIGKDFVPLTDVKVSAPGSPQQYLASTHINKANIIFVAEIDMGQPGKTDDGKLSMKVTKRPVAAEVHMPPYELVGKMHAEIWERLENTLEGGERFLPLTDVEITPHFFNGNSRFDFVAINKDKVLHVGEPAGSKAGFAPAGDSATKRLRQYLAGKLHAADRRLENVEKWINLQLQETEAQNIQEPEPQEPEPPELKEDVCSRCGYPLRRSLKWGLRSQTGIPLCRACRSPLA